MHRHCRRAVGGAVSALIAVLMAVPAAAGVLTTTIDLDYTYEQENLAGDVAATTQYFQKYEIKYETSLTTSLDFTGAVKLEIDDTWETNVAATSRTSPSLELQVKGAQSSVKLAYSGVINSTEQFRETRESETFSNSTDLDVELVPQYWPEVKLKLQRKRDYEEAQSDEGSRLGELQLRDDIFNVRLQFSLKREEREALLPERVTDTTTDWSWKATYKELLFAGTEFELDYEIKESYGESSRRGSFVSEDEAYTQTLKTRLKNALDLSSRLHLALSWEYAYEQDLLQLDFDYSVENKYQLELRYDMLTDLKLGVTATRDTALEIGTAGAEDTRNVADSVKGVFAYQPVAWLQFGGNAEWRAGGVIEQKTGGSEDRSEDVNAELIAKAKFGTILELGVDGTFKETRKNDWMEGRETKFKADGRLKIGDLEITPSYEAARTLSWEDGIEDPTRQTGTHDAKAKFAYKLQLLDLLQATFSHEYGVKITRELDEVSEYTRERTLTENTRLNVVLADLIAGLKMEGEIERAGDDTEGDAEPQIVEIAYSLKLDWKFETLSLAAALKYSDKGDEFDDLSFTSQVTWAGNQLDLTGGYEFTKVYADETDEDRKLNLKLSYKF